MAESNAALQFSDNQLSIIIALCQQDSEVASFVGRMDPRAPLQVNRTAIVAGVASRAERILNERTAQRERLAKAVHEEMEKRKRASEERIKAAAAAGGNGSNGELPLRVHPQDIPDLNVEANGGSKAETPGA